MRILVAGSNDFADYQTFIRGVAVAIDETLNDEKDAEGVLKEKTIHIYTAGPVNINNYTAEFTNMSERTIKAMGYKIKFHRHPYRQCVSNISNWKIERVVTFGIRDLTREPLAVTANFAGVQVNRY
jgi:hypothetical protein